MFIRSTSPTSVFALLGRRAERETLRLPRVEEAAAPRDTDVRATLSRASAALGAAAGTLDASGSYASLAATYAARAASLEATREVNEQPGGTVDATARFDGVGGAPGFDAGRSVAAGAFVVNGTQVNVEAADSIETVLARINATVSGVTATFDTATERVKLTAGIDGPTSISVGGDTSGFLAAVKLDGTATAQTNELDARLGDLAAFAGMGTGTLTVGDRAFTVGPTDRLRDLVVALDAVEGAAAKVGADGRLTLTVQGAKPGAVADTSGLLSRLGMAPGMLSTTADAPSLDAAAAAKSLSEALSEAIDGFNGAVRALYGEAPRSLQSALRAALRTEMEKMGASAAQLGLALDDGAAPQLAANHEKLEVALARGPVELSTLVHGLGSLTGAVAATIQAAQDQDRASNRTAELKASVERELVQLEPGVAAAMDRVVQARMAGLLDAAATQSTEEARRAREADKARKAYGVGDQKRERSGEPREPVAAPPAPRTAVTEGAGAPTTVASRRAR